jgi:hypothetical protein
LLNTLLLIAAALILWACAAPSPYVARGHIGLDHVSSSVDSELAAYYVTHYVGRAATDPERDRHIGELLSPYEGRPFSTAELTELARASSNDFAALYFAARMTREHRSLKERFLAYVAGSLSAQAHAHPYVVIFVPGLFYRTHPETKGDLRDAERLVRSLGIATDRVDTGDAETVEANAQRIATFIAERPDDGRQLILVSASKSGPEVLYALGKLVPEEKAKRVAAWVSIGGVLRGSPVADQYLEPPRSWLVGIVSWWMGFPCDMVASLSTARSSARFADAAIPAHVAVIHYVAVPLSGTITDEVRDAYKTMQPHGPSDGLTLLTDELLPQGKVITDIGMDHRYADPNIEAKTAALTRLVLDMLTENR